MKIGTFASALAIQVGVCGFGVISARGAELITIATVNNPDMIVMESLSSHFEDAIPGIKLKWVAMEENVLRQRVTSDIATHSAQLDVMTVGL